MLSCAMNYLYSVLLELCVEWSPKSYLLGRDYLLLCLPYVILNEQRKKHSLIVLNNIRPIYLYCSGSGSESWTAEEWAVYDRMKNGSIKSPGIPPDILHNVSLIMSTRCKRMVIRGVNAEMPDMILVLVLIISHNMKSSYRQNISIYQK